MLITLLRDIQHKIIKVEEGKRLFEIKEVGNLRLKNLALP